MSQTKVIKKYGNRKLYDTQDSKYVSLETIRQLVKGNVEFMVVDNISKQDITNKTLKQAAFDVARIATSDLKTMIRNS